MQTEPLLKLIFLQMAKIIDISDREAKRNENFEKLRNFSEAAKEYCEARNLTFNTVNEMLKEFYKYQNLGTEFKPFKVWSEEGRRVKKGSKGLLFWTRPLSELRKEKQQQQTAAQEQPAEDSEDNEPTRFSFMYLFSNFDLA